MAKEKIKVYKSVKARSESTRKLAEHHKAFVAETRKKSQQLATQKKKGKAITNNFGVKNEPIHNTKEYSKEEMEKLLRTTVSRLKGRIYRLKAAGYDNAWVERALQKRSWYIKKDMTLLEMRIMYLDAMSIMSESTQQQSVEIVKRWVSSKAYDWIKSDKELLNLFYAVLDKLDNRKRYFYGGSFDALVSLGEYATPEAYKKYLLDVLRGMKSLEEATENAKKQLEKERTNPTKGLNPDDILSGKVVL